MNEIETILARIMRIGSGVPADYPVYIAPLNSPRPDGPYGVVDVRAAVIEGRDASSRYDPETCMLRAWTTFDLVVGLKWSHDGARDYAQRFALWQATDEVSGELASPIDLRLRALDLDPITINEHEVEHATAAVQCKHTVVHEWPVPALEEVRIELRHGQRQAIVVRPPGTPAAA